MEEQEKSPVSQEINHDDNDACQTVKAELDTPVLSKRQLKRALKKQKWLENLPAKRAKEKERLKVRREEARASNITLGPTRKQLKSHTMADSKCKITVVLDFSFDHMMSSKDISKCVNQLLRCYSCNRRAENPMQFYVVNFNGLSKEEMGKHNGYMNWDVHFTNEDYMNIFDKDKIVYLTSDSDNVIENLEDDAVYVIGAIVDHNSHKGLCFNKAMEQGIRHGQLPLGKFLNMKTRKVLAINHVFEIMLLVSSKLTWNHAFQKVLPQRKGASSKDNDLIKTKS